MTTLTTEQRYQAALHLIMDDDQPTIEQHQAFIEQMYICAAAGTIDSESYLQMAEAHERIIEQKKWQANIDELGKLSKR